MVSESAPITEALIAEDDITGQWESASASMVFYFGKNGLLFGTDSSGVQKGDYVIHDDFVYCNLPGGSITLTYSDADKCFYATSNSSVEIQFIKKEIYSSIEGIWQGVFEISNQTFGFAADGSAYFTVEEDPSVAEGSYTVGGNILSMSFDELGDLRIYYYPEMDVIYLPMIDGSISFYSHTDNEVSSLVSASELELTEKERMIAMIVELMDDDLAFDSGDYVKGDIPEGEYAFVRFGSGQYYSERDAAGNIIDNENFDSFGYVQVHGLGDISNKGILVSVDAFEALGVSGAKALYEIINEQTDWNQSGYYKIGYDLDAGDYTVESIGGRGYYAVMTGPVGDSRIVENDSFDGKKSVSVSGGQYLTLSRAMIIP